MSCILKTSTAKGDGAWLCTYLAAGATQPDMLVLRIMGHDHLVKAMGTSVEAKQEQRKKKKIKLHMR